MFSVLYYFSMGTPRNIFSPIILSTMDFPKVWSIASFRIPGINTTHATLSTENQRVVTIGTETGVLMEPSHMDTKQTYPLVIWLHGGPQRQTSYGWHPYHSYGTYDAILELLRKNNALILKLDYRGSFGFGKEYIESIRGSVGDGDVTDVMNALAYMKKQYNIGNTYLVGNSYGGYLSLRTIVEHPGSFSGAFSINGVTDWESLLARLKTSIFNIDFGGAPSADTMSAYKQASIIDRTSNLGNQKIAIVAGEADRTIPVSQSRMLYEDLLSKKKNVELVVYPGEDHVYKKKETISNLCEKIFSFMQITKDPSCDM